MKFPNLHIVWTEGKNLSLPDLLSRSLTTTTQDEHRLRTVEIPESIKFFMTHNLNTQPIQCNYAVSKEYINTVSENVSTEQIHFPIYLQTKNNYFEVQFDNDLYLPVSYHEFCTKSQPLEHVNQKRNKQMQTVYSPSKLTLSYNIQMSL